jgi:hypothetical protein
MWFLFMALNHQEDIEFHILVREIALSVTKENLILLLDVMTNVNK